MHNIDIYIYIYIYILIHIYAKMHTYKKHTGTCLHTLIRVIRNISISISFYLENLGQGRAVQHLQ